MLIKLVVYEEFRACKPKGSDLLIKPIVYEELLSIQGAGGGGAAAAATAAAASRL